MESFENKFLIVVNALDADIETFNIHIILTNYIKVMKKKKYSAVPLSIHNA